MAIYYTCSDGERITEATIKRRYSESIKKKHIGQEYFRCEACGRKAVHNDHTIAKARCKVIGKSELIYDPLNYVDSCASCHEQWESFKSGDWLLHANYENRLEYMRIYDIEGCRKRIELTKMSLEE